MRDGLGGHTARESPRRDRPPRHSLRDHRTPDTVSCHNPWARPILSTNDPCSSRSSARMPTPVPSQSHASITTNADVKTHSDTRGHRRRASLNVTCVFENILISSREEADPTADAHLKLSGRPRSSFLARLEAINLTRIRTPRTDARWNESSTRGAIGDRTNSYC